MSEVEATGTRPNDLAGSSVVADPSLRRREGGRILYGGSPLRLMRISDRAARLLDRLLDGDPVPTSPNAQRFVRRLLDGDLVQPTPRTSPFTATDVTVVIPVRGTLDPALLDGLGEVAGIIVVDDASTEAISVPDRTDHGVAVTLIRHDANRGPAAARNTGLAEVATPLVAFVDADCRPRPGWIGPLLAQFTDPTVAAVAPRIVAATSDRIDHGSVSGLLDRYERVDAALDRGTERGRVRARTRIPYVPSAALVCAVEPLRALGGFDESMRTGEDVDLVWRLDEHDHTVRYEPSATVAHHHRTTPWAWARRRFDYGASAGPLSRRHPGALVPVEASGWSYATWLLLAAGHPLAAAAAVGATIGQLDRRLDSLDHPLPVTVPLTLRGHLGAGRLLARAIVRPWWPITLLCLMIPSRRLRLVLLGGAIAPALLDWVRRRPDIHPIAYLGLRLADDVAYSAGVWVGSIRSLAWEPLVPELTAWPKPGRYARWRASREH